MQKSLLEQVPGIIAKGRQQAEHVLENLQACHRAILQTREWVLPAKDNTLSDWIKAGEQRRLIYGQTEQQPNCLIHGDNLPAMAALLVGDDAMPSLRGKIDLIHIDAPFGSGADDRTETASQRAKQRRAAIRQFACSDQWAGTVASYLEMLVPRLILMRELLSSNGAICICPDWRVRQYAKLVMDEVFGAQNLLALEWLNQGILLAGKGKASDRERYQNIDGMRCPGAWTAIASPPGNENIGAKTEKPAFLLEGIILATTNPESIVADFFGGAGNTAAVAERLGRRWIISDSGIAACMGIRNRLADRNAKPFLYQTVDDYPTEAAKFPTERIYPIGDVSQIVLLLYGALPLPSKGNNLGQVVTGGSKTLVVADSPNNLTGAATLKKAIAQRDSPVDGWDKVVVLGWNFEPSIAASVAALNDSRLEVLVIPSDLLDRFSTKRGAKMLGGPVRFASLHT